MRLSLGLAVVQNEAWSRVSGGRMRLGLGLVVEQNEAWARVSGGVG